MWEGGGVGKRGAWEGRSREKGVWEGRRRGRGRNREGEGDVGEKKAVRRRIVLFVR